MPLFGKKKEEEPVTAPPPSTTPVDLVLQMRQQGFNNNQIVQSLQREGYKSHQIFDALNQADLRSQQPPPTSPEQPPGAPPYPPTEAPPLPEEQFPPEAPLPPPPGAPPPQAPFPSAPPSAVDKEKIEEIAETIIDEKWEVFEKDVKKILEWKDKTESQMLELTQQIKGIKESFDNLHTGVLGKIAEYDKSIISVGTEIKALEKVFQKILPTLTENVGELSRITRGMRGTTKRTSKKV